MKIDNDDWAKCKYYMQKNKIVGMKYNYSLEASIQNYTSF